MSSTSMAKKRLAQDHCWPVGDTRWAELVELLDFVKRKLGGLESETAQLLPETLPER